MTITFITPVAGTRKAILLIIDGGEALAMGRVGSVRQVSSDERPRDTIRAEESRGDHRFTDATQHRKGCAINGCGSQHAAEMAETARVPDSVPGSPPDRIRQAVARLPQGIEPGPDESLAETTARAMGISVRDLRAKLELLAGRA